eukprot:snap_masked-scaffold_71-processed-gene-0.16-mRNA-1 protein AED:1.00 eAED:1.00 QI:0/-1/0/0/-1/1/1/0/385
MDQHILVADIGSGYSKVGFPDDDEPHLCFPTVVARSFDEQEVSVGETVLNFTEQERKANLTSKPVMRGGVADLSDYELLWDHIFANYETSSTEIPLLLSDLPLTSPSSKEKIVELLYESYLTPSLAFYNQSSGSLYAQGKTTGLVLDSGEGKTSVLPIVDGFSVLQSLQMLDVGGQDLTQSLHKRIRKYSKFPGKEPRMDWVQSLKEKHCFVCMNYDQVYTDSRLEREKYFIDDVEYKLPDGEKITFSLEEELFQIPEGMFKPDVNPSYQYMKSKSLPMIMAESVARSESDETTRRTLFSNVLLTGGNMRFKGMRERMGMELKKHVPKDFEVEMLEVENPLYSVWQGGSILTSMGNIGDRMTTREEYLENGGLSNNKKLSLLDFS